MENIKEDSMEQTLSETRWKSLYKISAIAVFATVLIMTAEIILTMLPDGSRATTGTLTIAGWFELFERNWFMAMRNLGLINLIATTLTIPVFFSLFGLHRKENVVYAGFAFIVFLASYAIFVADNAALPMLALSIKYSSMDSESQKIVLLAAGEALIVRGGSHTPGSFPGFFLSEMASIIMCIVMLKGKTFKKITSKIGLIAFVFLFIFEVVSSFMPSLFEAAMVFAAIGGILAIYWYVMLGKGLLMLSK